MSTKHRVRFSVTAGAGNRVVPLEPGPGGPESWHWVSWASGHGAHVSSSSTLWYQQLLCILRPNLILLLVTPSSSSQWTEATYPGEQMMRPFTGHQKGLKGNFQGQDVPFLLRLQFCREGKGEPRPLFLLNPLRGRGRPPVLLESATCSLKAKTSQLLLPTLKRLLPRENKHFHSRNL